MIEELKPMWGKYIQHKSHSKSRGIDFQLTFEEWWDIWDKSGHWQDRGRGLGKYCMSRIGDLGPYAVGNVFIQSNSDNNIQGMTGRKRSQETKDKISKSNKGQIPASKGKPAWNRGIPKSQWKITQ